METSNVFGFSLRIRISSGVNVFPGMMNHPLYLLVYHLRSFFVVRLLSTFRGFAQSYCPLLWVVAFKVSTNRDSLQFIRPFYGEYFILIFPTLSANIRKLPVFSAFCWLFPPVSGNFEAVLNWTFGLSFTLKGAIPGCNRPGCSITAALSSKS